MTDEIRTEPQQEEVGFDDDELRDEALDRIAGGTAPACAWPCLAH
jgi:hypothetical protein